MTFLTSDDELLTPEQVAEKYPFKKDYLAILRHRGEGPTYLNPTVRTILYRKSDIEQWLTDSIRNPQEQETSPSGIHN